MNIAAQIKTQYKRVGDKAVQTIRVSVKQDTVIRAGQTIVVNSGDRENITIEKEIPRATPYYSKY